MRRPQFSFTIDPDDYIALDALAKAHRVKKADIARYAIRQVLAEHAAGDEGNGDAGDGGPRRKIRTRSTS